MIQDYLAPLGALVVVSAYVAVAATVFIAIHMVITRRKK